MISLQTILTIQKKGDPHLAIFIPIDVEEPTTQYHCVKIGPNIPDMVSVSIVTMEQLLDFLILLTPSSDFILTDTTERDTTNFLALLEQLPCWDEMKVRVY